MDSWSISNYLDDMAVQFLDWAVKYEQTELKVTYILLMQKSGN